MTPLGEEQLDEAKAFDADMYKADRDSMRVSTER